MAAVSGGWRFDFRHLHAKSASLSPFKRFAFELRDIARRQPLPGYRLAVERDAGGRELLAFSPHEAFHSRLWTICGPHVLSGTDGHVPSGTGRTCYQEPKSPNSSARRAASGRPNLESNDSESNSSEVDPGRDEENLPAMRHEWRSHTWRRANPHRIDLASAADRALDPVRPRRWRADPRPPPPHPELRAEQCRRLHPMGGGRLRRSMSSRANGTSSMTGCAI